MADATRKGYLQLMRDLSALRRSRALESEDAACAELDREIGEHVEEIGRRNRHGR